MKIWQAQVILKDMGLPNNTETIRRWIRSGLLPAEKPLGAKEYEFTEDDFLNVVELKLKEKADKGVLYQRAYNDGFQAAKQLWDKTRSVMKNDDDST